MSNKTEEKEYLIDESFYYGTKNLYCKTYTNLNGFFHRIGGPARTWYFEDGITISGFNWYIHGLIHREDGPAILVYDRLGNIVYEYYYLNNQRITETEFKLRIFTGLY